MEGTKSQVAGSAEAKVIIELRTGGMRSCQKWEEASSSRCGGRLGLHCLQLWGCGAESQSWGSGLGARGACQTVSSSLMSQICVEKGRRSVSARPWGHLSHVGAVASGGEARLRPRPPSP